MQASDLISFVPLHDDRGRTVARFYPQSNVITFKAGNRELSFPLTGAETKATCRQPIKAQVKTYCNTPESVVK